MEVKLKDRQSDFLGESTREYTEQGFLKVKGRVARSGIQSYYGYELGLNDSDKRFKLFNVYRPPEIVLNDTVCEMYKGVDVTNGHPKDFVNSKSYKQLTSGVVLGKAYRDENNSDYLLCDMLIKDEKTIKDIERGKVALSVGYRNTMVMEDGTTPTGEHYDLRVENISLVNHVALVSRARAGFEAKLLDTKGDRMSTIKIGSLEVDVSDEMAAGISDELQKIETRVSDAEALLSQKDVQLGEKSAEIEQLKQDLKDAQEAIITDEDIKKIVTDKEQVMSKARIIVGDTFTCDSFDPSDIMRKALSESEFSADISDESDDFVKGAFNVAVSALEEKRAIEAEAKDAQAKMAEALKKGFKGGEEDEDEDVETPEEKYKRETADAYKKSCKK